MKIKKIGLIKRNNLKGLIFISPFLLGAFFIFLPSVIQSFYYSLNKVTITTHGLDIVFNGILNYKNAFALDLTYRVLLLDAIKRLLTDVLIIVIFSFFIANLLNQKFIGRSVFRTIFFLPVILATGLVTQMDMNSLVMNIFQNNQTGEIVKAAGSAGLTTGFNFKQILLSLNLGSDIVKVIIDAIKSIKDTVNASGVQILIFLAGLHSISPSVFEAADVEGATRWESFWKITFPMMLPMIIVNVLYTIIDTFTRPSYGVLSYIQAIAFNNNQHGYASAMAWIYFLFISVFITVAYFIINKASKVN